MNDKRRFEKFWCFQKIEKSLRDGWDIDPDERNLKILLYELGFSNSVVNFILDEYGAEIIQLLVLKPYSLAMKYRGFRLKTFR